MSTAADRLLRGGRRSRWPTAWGARTTRGQGPTRARNSPRGDGRWVTIGGHHVFLPSGKTGTTPKGAVGQPKAVHNIVGPDTPLRQKIEDWVAKQYPPKHRDSIVQELSSAFASGEMTEFHKRAWRAITGKDAPPTPRSWPKFGQDWR